jgi:hypothetical protein
MELLRTPLVVVGLLLTVIGFGNVYTGQNKTAEYEQLLANRTLSARQRSEAAAEGRGSLRSSLLTTFERDQVPSAAARSKLDFYRVVDTGGRLLTLLGAFCAIGGILLAWYRRTQPDTSGMVSDA